MSDVPTRKVDIYSACAFPISLSAGEAEIGRATGFLWKMSGRVLLLSNWHVFSGRKPSTGRPINPLCAIPDTIKFQCASKMSPMVEHSVAMSLQSRDGRNVWMQSGEYGQRVDIAFLDVTGALHDPNCAKAFSEDVICINEQDENHELIARIGSPVFVLGFPLKVRPTGIFPILKRASIATEVDLDVNGLPSFLIDTATREGMSGSPVIQRLIVESPGNQLLWRAAPTGDTRFLGMYSGRHIGEIGEAQLGIVWKRNVIESLLMTAVPGDFDLL